jgi:hypothetical protein
MIGGVFVGCCMRKYQIVLHNLCWALYPKLYKGIAIIIGYSYSITMALTKDDEWAIDDLCKTFKSERSDYMEMMARYKADKLFEKFIYQHVLII